MRLRLVSINPIGASAVFRRSGHLFQIGMDQGWKSRRVRSVKDASAIIERGLFRAPKENEPTDFSNEKELVNEIRRRRQEVVARMKKRARDLGRPQ